MSKYVKKVLVSISPIVIVLSMCVLKIVYQNFIDGKFLPCWFNLLTGYLCPGCGGTRSFFLLMHGDIISSFKYNAFVPTMVIFAIISYIRLFLKVVLEKNITVFPKDDRFVYIPLVLFLIYFVLRNIIPISI